MKEYLKVPYAEKEQAKALGARWDPQARSWFVPEDLEPTRFQRWRDSPSETPVIAAVTESGSRSETDRYAAVAEDAGRELIDLAKKVGRAPYVVLLRQSCWRCGRDGYAVEVCLYCTKNRLSELPVSSSDYPSLSFAACGHGGIFSVGGGRVAEIAGLVTLLQRYSQAHRTVPTATLKSRYSKTAGEHYMSQGCPACDALWGDFPLSELSIRYMHQIMAGQYEAPHVIRAFDLVVR